MAYATVDDVRLIWPGLPEDQDARTAELLEDAAVRIDSFAPLPEPPVELTERQLAVRKTVSREMVVYVLMADSSAEPPMTQKSRTMGPFSESWTYDRPGRTLMLTDEHKRMLSTRGHTRAFSVSMIRDPA